MRIEITRKHYLQKSVFMKLIKAYGLRYDKNTFTGEVSEQEFKELKRLCSRYDMDIKAVDSFVSRGKNYRNDYFRYNSPVFFGLYRCAYCGKLLTRENVEVDHLYPAGLASRNLRVRKKVMRYADGGVNGIDNLVSACRKCNRRKGSKGGLWIMRGRIGRHPTVWLIKDFFRISIVLAGIYILYLNHDAVLSCIKAFSDLLLFR